MVKCALIFPRIDDNLINLCGFPDTVEVIFLRVSGIALTSGFVYTKPVLAKRISGISVTV